MRINIDFGIDLGTTNSAISKMDNGIPRVVKTEEQVEIMPSCVHFTNKKTVLVGNKALNALKTDNTNALKNFSKGKVNTFSEFKRTMGTNKTYECSNMGVAFTSDELSCEVLKKLKSLVLDENVDAVVITVPAKFKNQQKEATIRAAKLAGLKQVVLLNEPVAAATAYGLDTTQKDGYWLVYDFGGGTFDVALIKAEDGILEVKDTDGNEWLGGKNLDEAIVDHLLIPNLQANYVIDKLLNNPEKRMLLRDVLKPIAEEGKIVLSFKDSHRFVSNLGDLPFSDEKGQEPEVDVLATQQDMERVLSPLFQKTIDITKSLLDRNNLTGSQLHALILVGGPTFSPILRRMLKEQITPKVDTSIDPMTAVAKGAALFASIIQKAEINRDFTKLQLELDYSATSVEESETIGISILSDKSEGNLNSVFWVEISRADGGFTSERVKLGAKSGLAEVLLVKGQSNVFQIRAFDDEGNRIPCQPEQFNILQGIIVDEMATLHYHIGIGLYFPGENRELFEPVKGLEKNKKVPANGVINGLKTRTTLIPGNKEEKLTIPIYQGDYNAPGTNPLLNNLIYEVVINGTHIQQTLPEGSEIDITIRIDRSEHLQFSAFFPLLDHHEELSIVIKNTDPPTAEELSTQIEEAIQTAIHINARELSEKLNALKNQLNIEKGSFDGRFNILNELRKLLLMLDTEKQKTVWPELEKELNEEFDSLNKVVDLAKGDERINWELVDGYINDYKRQLPIVLRDKNIKEARVLINDIYSTRYEIVNIALSGELNCDKLRKIQSSFNDILWTNQGKARELLNEGIQLCSEGKANAVSGILRQLYTLMPKSNRTILEL